MDTNKTYNETSGQEGEACRICSDGCCESMSESTPDMGLPKKTGKKGWFANWLDRLAKANEKTFGKDGPKCCH